MKSGSNDRCLCTGGTKLKECCVDKRKADERQAMLDAAVREVRELLESRSFASLEEANAFLNRHMQQRNRAPEDDFDGLSSGQMHRLLHYPFESPDLAAFPACLDVVPDAPILRLFSLLVEKLGDQGLKATTTGNLPRNLCREIALTYWGEEKYREVFRYGELRTEPMFFDLHVTRIVSGLSGLVRKYRGKFIVSNGCRRLLNKQGLAGIYPRLFREFATKYNWAYWGGRSEIPLIQQSFLFTLYLLRRHGTEWRSCRFYEDWFLRAFPAVLNEVVPIGEYLSPEKVLRGSYSWRCLDRFAGFLGLVEIRRDPGKGLRGDFLVRKLPLLDHVVQFHL
ncbi:MAG TPA: hypothetical protein PLM79_11220 [Syntrophobacteraceae bacterium]|nr:hypothetical protein [Syntrophobacteraceae bacterium]